MKRHQQEDSLWPQAMKRDDSIETATIMVVDDVPANLNILKTLLMAKGYRVIAFPNGPMALRAAFRNPPDLILLDIMMPGMDGLEVCRQLKLNDKVKDIPVLFITALSETEDKLKGFAVGGSDYITKPFQFEEVHARIAMHLRMYKMKMLLEKHNLYLERLVEEKVREIVDSQFATLLAVIKLAEYRDDETGQHIERTRNFCKTLAEELRRNPHYSRWIDDAFVQNIFHAAPLHDIGKVGIPDSILLKPGRLTPEEFEIMKTHTLIGAKALEAARSQYPRNDFVNLGIAIARSHHEKWDGSGYPDGLVGEAIPMAARIMAVADVYDALRSHRPYKPAFSHEHTVKIITMGDGRTMPHHFDPAVLQAFQTVAPKFARIYHEMADDPV